MFHCLLLEDVPPSRVVTVDISCPPMYLRTMLS